MGAAPPGEQNEAADPVPPVWGAHARPRRWARVVPIAAIAVVLLVVAASLAIADPWQDAPDDATDKAATKVTTRRVTAGEARRAPSVVVPERPTRIRLPDGAVLPVDVASTRADGVLDVPAGVDTAGWWGGGSRIGDPFGAIVVAAHVDSTSQGLGPYAQLLQVDRGAPVGLRSAGLTQKFVIRSRTLIPRRSLPNRDDVLAATGGPRLVLITCAGPYDADKGGYQNLAVVTAVPVGAPRPADG